MSGKFKFLSLVLVAFLALGFYATTAKADVTGSFGFNVLFNPIPCQVVIVGPAQTPTNLADQPCERTVYRIDFETDLNINIAISGLTMGIHSHLGNTGLEDVILSFAATLGALDIADDFVFAQPFGAIIDGDGQVNYACYENAPGSGECDLFFVKKRVSATISLGGVTFENLAILEDVNFPDCNVVPGLGCVTKPAGGTYTVEDQAFGFGDVISITGQTPSGITITGSTGFCAQPGYNLIKKHYWLYTVNPDCAAGQQEPSPKPPLFFDFETLDITGIPLAADLFVDFSAACDNNATVPYSCAFTVAGTFTGATLFNPITFSIDFENVTGEFAFGGGLLVLSAGSATFYLYYSDTLDLSLVLVDIALTLNPDTNPATLLADFSIYPGTGLTDFTLQLVVQRAGLDLTMTSVFAGPPVMLQSISVGLTAEAGVISISASAGYSFTVGALTGNLSAGVSF